MSKETIEVPVSELEKLEQSRVELYKFLGDKLDTSQMSTLINITGQIWRVANSKKVDK